MKHDLNIYWNMFDKLRQECAGIVVNQFFEKDAFKSVVAHLIADQCSQAESRSSQASGAVKRHEYADVAEAFGNGKTIQYEDSAGHWVDWSVSYYPAFTTSIEPHAPRWRIKPESKPDIVMDRFISPPGNPWRHSAKPAFIEAAMVRFTWDSETKKLKSAVVL
jgi:hypothetical protein